MNFQHTRNFTRNLECLCDVNLRNGMHIGVLVWITDVQVVPRERTTV
jgi:hypothetical protein